MKRVAVIGAGMAGCSAAYELLKMGIDVTLFEKAPYVGGRTATFRSHEMSFNTGAAFFTNFFSRTNKYVDELELRHQVIKGKNADIYFVDENRTVPFDMTNFRTFVQYPFLTFPEKLHVILKTLDIRLRKLGFDWVDPQDLSADDFETVAEFARRTFGQNTSHYLIRHGIEPYWYFSTEQVSASMAIALQAHAINAKFFTLASGMDTIACKISSMVRTALNTVVARVRCQTNGRELIVQTSEGLEEKFDGVVVATTTDSALEITSDIPFIPESHRQFLDTQEYVRHIVVAYSVDKNALQGISGEFHPIGNWDYGAAAVLVKGLQHLDINDNLETVVVYLTQNTSQKLMSESDENVSCIAWKHARLLCGQLPPDFVDSRIVRRQQAIPIVEVGRFKRAAQMLQGQAGPVVFAGDYFSIPCIEGTIFSAQKAVESLIGRQ